MLKKLKNDDQDKNPEGGGGVYQQPGVLRHLVVLKLRVIQGRQLVVYHDSTNVQPVNTLKVNMVLFMDDRGVVMRMVYANEIDEGVFVDHSYMKGQIAILLNLNVEAVDEPERQEDLEVEDSEELCFDMNAPTGNTSYDDDFVEMEDVTAVEYSEMYTQANNGDDGIPFIATEHFEAAEECVKKRKEK